MTAKRIAELFKLVVKIWGEVEPLRDAHSALSSTVKNLEVSPPIPCDDDDIVETWAILEALDRDVLQRIEKSKSGEYNVFSKQETANALSAFGKESETCIKIKNAAMFSKIAVNDLKSLKTTSGVAIRLATFDLPSNSLYFGREPLIEEINRLAESMIARCEKVGTTRRNMSKDAKWILELHGIK